MWFKPKDALTEQDVQRGMKAVIWDGMASTAMGTFTGGVFLTAYALKLGASNSTIGILAAIAPLMALIQIPSIYLVEKLRNRKVIVVSTSLVSRSFWLLVAAIPFVFPAAIGVKILIIGMALYSLFGAVSGTAWNPWLRDILPQDRLGQFFSKRMRMGTILGIVLSLVCAAYLDQWTKYFPKQEMSGYSILFLCGFIAGIIGVYFLSTIPEPRMAVPEKKTGFLSILLIPFKDENFRRLMAFSGSWTFAVNLAAPFFTVYMIKRLDFSMAFIVGLSVVSQVTHLVFLKIWGKFTDRFSNKSVLRVSGPLFLFTILAWTFTTLPYKHMFTIPLVILIHVFLGMSTAGINLGAGNIGFKLAPKGKATAFLTVNNFINSLAAGMSPILGGRLADFVSEYEVSWTLKFASLDKVVSVETLNFQSWDFFFAVAFLCGLYAMHRLSLVKEVGEVDEKIVFNELVTETRKEIQNFTTVAGLRQMVNFPFTAFRYVKVKGRRKASQAVRKVL